MVATLRQAREEWARASLSATERRCGRFWRRVAGLRDARSGNGSTPLAPDDTLGIATGSLTVEGVAEDSEGSLQPLAPYSVTGLLLEKQGMGDEPRELQEVVVACPAEAGPPMMAWMGMLRVGALSSQAS